MSKEPAKDQVDEPVPWQQGILDNLWLLLALSILVPGLMYLLWGLWELGHLPLWVGK